MKKHRAGRSEPLVRLGSKHAELLPLADAATELGLTPEGLRTKIERDEIAANWPGDSGPDNPVFISTGAIAAYREWRGRHRGEEGEGQ